MAIGARQGDAADLDGAGLDRQRAVFHRVGGQFVDDEAERDRGARGDLFFQIAQRQPRTVRRHEGREFGHDDVMRGHVRPRVFGQQAVGRCQRPKPAVEGLVEAFQRILVHQRAAADRLDQCQRVLHAMVEFAHQKQLVFLGRLSLREID